MKRIWLVPGTTAVAAALTAAHLWGVPYSMPAELLAKTVLAFGGNGNTDGLLMDNELAGYIKPGDPNYSLCDTTGGCATDIFTRGTWNASAIAVGTTFDSQQADGVRSMDQQLRAALAAEKAAATGDDPDPEIHVVVVGYSSSADVVAREMRALQAQRDAGDSDALDPSEVSFLVMGNPNRPNGGILARFPVFTIPLIDVPLGTSNPETDYQLTDISWEYDLASDAPAYLNPLAFANGVLGFFYQHSFYFGADPNDEAAVIYDDIDPDGNRYITIEAKHLALLQPLYDIGVPGRVLDSIEPTLKVLIDLGYDRETPAWQPTTLKLAPPPEQVAAALPKLQAALEEGAAIALGQKPPPSDSDSDTENATLAVLENVLGGFLKDGSWDSLRRTIENILNPKGAAANSNSTSALTRGSRVTQVDSVEAPARQVVSQLREDARQFRDAIKVPSERPARQKLALAGPPKGKARPDIKPVASDVSDTRDKADSRVQKRIQKTVERVRDRAPRADANSHESR